MQINLILLQALIMQLHSTSIYPQDYASQLRDGDEFDFIIIGAGSAGSVLANRLSEVPDWKILLLEAGSYPSETTEVPAKFLNLLGTSEDWSYETESCDNCCLGLRNQRCLYQRGKVLGGTSAINGMIYERSTEKDHEEWVEAGNDGWDYNRMLKYYKKIEDGEQYRLNLTRVVSKHPFKSILTRSYQELGYSVNDDTYVTIFNGTRVSAAKAFLTGVNNRQNLHVGLGVLVTKILLNERNQAQAIRVLVQDQTLTLKFRKEVIVSAGTISSPQILMLSGIGSKNHLGELGIDLRKELQVGSNLQDHVAYPGLFITINDSFLPKIFDIDRVKPSLSNFNLYLAKNQSKYPNMQINHFLFYQNNPKHLSTFAPVFNLAPDTIKILIEENKKSSILLLMPQIFMTKSAGKILLRNKDPLQKPKIYPNFFSDPNNDDFEMVLHTIKMTKHLLNTKDLAQLQPELINLKLKNCNGFKYDSDHYWRCAVKNLGTHLHHPVGTCKMGPRSDPTAVVGPDLKIHGVDGVRVADASVMPTIPRCKPNAPTLMIGEKCSELIQQKWLQNHEL